MECEKEIAEYKSMPHERGERWEGGGGKTSRVCFVLFCCCTHNTIPPWTFASKQAPGHGNALPYSKLIKIYHNGGWGPEHAAGEPSEREQCVRPSPDRPPPCLRPSPHENNPLLTKFVSKTTPLTAKLPGVVG